MKSVITTDFHSHILPLADHGSDGVETSLKQLDIMRSYGMQRIVATPHFYPTRDNVMLFLERRNDCARELLAAMKKDHPPVMLGAEVMICDGIENMEGLEKLSVCGTRCILLEMPMTKWTDRTYDTVEAISRMDLFPVIAHVDRYNPKYVEELLTLDVKAQLNPEALLGRKQRRLAEKWLSEGKIAAVGSDLHMAREKEYKNFATAIGLLGEYADEIERSMMILLHGAKVMAKK